MFVDSHCHLNDPRLKDQIYTIQQEMLKSQVLYAMLISTTLEEFPSVYELSLMHKNWWATVGVHPEYDNLTNNTHIQEPTIDDLISRASLPKVVGIGETGLDYYHFGEQNKKSLEWQRERFRTHIRAAQACRKPLIIHTRAASQDTISILKEMGEQGSGKAAGGVFHCFTETVEVARQALDLGFYISFSGILTFKNAQSIRDVATFIPLDKCLIETDSPYLAPAPHRGKVNSPAYIPYIAVELARLKGLSLEEIGQITSNNYFSLFKNAIR